MTNQTHTEAQESTESQSSVNADDMSFSDYERMRRGEPVAESKPKAALAEKSAEQKKSPASDTEETEAKDVEDESSEEESDEEEGKEDESEKEKPRKKGGFQRRIDKLNARYAEERQQREALEQRLAQLEGAGDSKSKKVETKVEAGGKPSPDDYESHADYVDALTDWKIDQREKAKVEHEQKSKLQTEQQKLIQDHSARVESFKKKTADFDDVLSEVDEIPVSPAVQELILTSDNGPALMYELAKNPEEFERINKLSPLAAARELGRLESKLSAQASEEKKPEPKKLTKAPKPIDPVGTGKGSVAKSIDDPNLSFSEYERMRREQLKRRQG